eukprot:5376969-Alexandrium_andersonii.AAC.1
MLNPSAPRLPKSATPTMSASSISMPAPPSTASAASFWSSSSSGDLEVADRPASIQLPPPTGAVQHGPSRAC